MSATISSGLRPARCLVSLGCCCLFVFFYSPGDFKLRNAFPFIFIFVWRQGLKVSQASLALTM